MFKKIGLLLTILITACTSTSGDINQATFSPMNGQTKAVKQHELLKHSIYGKDLNQAQAYSNEIFQDIKSSLKASDFAINKVGTDTIMIAPINLSQNYDFSIKDSFKWQLNNLAKVLKHHKSTVVEITGHTDSIGSFENNKNKSVIRAKIIAQYLINKGIIPQRIFFFGLGESKWIAPNSTPEGRNANNRIEIRISPIITNQNQ